MPVKDGPACPGCGLPNYEGLCPHCGGEVDDFGGLHLLDCPYVQPTGPKHPLYVTLEEIQGEAYLWLSDDHPIKDPSEFVHSLLRIAQNALLDPTPMNHPRTEEESHEP